MGRYEYDIGFASNVDFEDCPDCGVEDCSGICANCEDDGEPCEACGSTGRCPTCGGAGRRKVESDPEVLAEVEAAGPLIVPESERGSDA